MEKFIFISLLISAMMMSACQKADSICCSESLKCYQYCNDLIAEYEKARKQDLLQCGDHLEKALQSCEQQFPTKTGPGYLACQLATWKSHNICWQSGELKFREGWAEVEQCLEDCKTNHKKCNQ